MLKEYFPSIVIVALLGATIATTPTIDSTEANAFFYIQRLPLSYHLCVLSSILTAFLSKKRFNNALSLCVFTILIIGWPSIMLVNPWHLDSYPFVAQAVYVARNGHIGDFALLSESPALGLIFGAFLSVTGFNPISLLDLYQFFWAVTLVSLIYLIAKTLGFDHKFSVISAMLVVSIFWPNEHHLSRQSLVFISYLISILLFFKLTMRRADRRISLLLILQIFVMVLAHPATPLFFLANLISIVLLGTIMKKITSREIRLTFSFASILSILWLLWNLRGTEGGIIQTLFDIGDRIWSSLAQNPAEVSGIVRIFTGYTRTYGTILNVRFLYTSIVFGAIFSVPLLVFLGYRYSRKLMSSPANWRVLLLSTAWAWSNLLWAVPLLFAGLPYFAKPALFGFASWGVLGLVAYEIISRQSKRRLQKKVKQILRYSFILVFAIVPALILPVIKYAPIPYIYPTSNELANKHFLDSNWSGEILLYLEFYRPIYYSYSLHGFDEPIPDRRWIDFASVLIPGEGLNYSAMQDATIWMTRRVISRDGFYAYTPSMLEIALNISDSPEKSRQNRIYDAGWPELIFAP